MLNMLLHMKCFAMLHSPMWIAVLWLLALFQTTFAQPRPPILLTFYLQEEMQPGSLVGNIVEEAGLTQRYSGDILEHLRFSFLSEPTLRFELEHRSGNLFAKERIDREQICPMEEHCQDRFDVAIRPVSILQIVKVTVVIEDINDNAPMFSETIVTHQLLESAPRYTAVSVPSAVDTDSPIFGIQNYTWNDPSNKFVLETVRKIDGSTDLKLLLRKSLDREVTDSYKITVTAYDGTGLSGSTDIAIEVLDANDNNPIFSNDSYEVTIEENIELEDIILKVQASDLDIGENGDILYGFTSRTNNKYGHLFEIDIYTGDIRVIGDIDYEEHQIFHLGVTAKDQGRGSRSADTTVVVNVQDTNDNAPAIVINTLLDPSTEPENDDLSGNQYPRAEVLENSEIGTFVAHVTVSDSDKGNNGRFDCFLNNDHFKLNSLYDTEYAIVTDMALDRETKAHYKLLIECADYGTPMRTAMSRLHVTIADRNDHDPEFEQNKYTASVDENNYASLVILTVHATDGDIGKNGKINYVLDPQVALLFDLDETQGILSAATSLNREDYIQDMGRIEFSVYAYDQGEPQRYGKARVVITVQDLNDESPVFTNNQYSFGIFENEPVGTSVGQVLAKDLDSPPYNQHVFRFSENNNRRIIDLFSLDEKTGEIHTLVTFDTEMQAMYRFTVTAIDTDDLDRVGFANVSVYIGDKNDNPPKFSFPTSANHTVQVSAMLGKNRKVTRVLALDRDQGDKIRYSIVSGMFENLFSINEHTGIIRTTRPLATALSSSYELIIQARDAIHVESASIVIAINHSLPLPPMPANTDKTVSDSAATNFLSGLSLIIIILLAGASAIIAVILIIAIIVIHRRSRNHKNSEGRYNCRQEEAKKILATHAHTDAQKQSDENFIQPVVHNPSVVESNDERFYSPVNEGTLPRNGTLKPQTSSTQHFPHLNQMHSIEAQHLVATDQDSGRGASEDENGTPVHFGSGGRKVTLMDTNSLSRKDNSTGSSNSGYHKMKPDFRTFSPISALPPEVDVSGSGSYHTLQTTSGQYPANNDIIIRSLSPKLSFSQTIHPQNKSKAKFNAYNREKHSANSYTPGINVDLDDCTYPVNDFIHNSDAREDAV